MKRGPKPKPLEALFWPKVKKGRQCWQWAASCSQHGYGQVQQRVPSGKQKRWLAHRLSWVLHFGPIPEGAFVLHRCDNPGCVRPDHLFLGTQADNIHDCVAKGRHVPPRLRGEGHGSSKLSADDVVKIRDDVRPRSVIAHEYGVHTNTIANVQRRLNWRHIT